MNLIEAQILEMDILSSVPSKTVLVIVVGNDINNAVNSLRDQIYTNFCVYHIEDILNKNAVNGKINIFDIQDKSIVNEMSDALNKSIEDYVLILEGHDRLTPNALLEYIKLAEVVEDADLIYANEAVGNIPDSILEYQIKPLPSFIACFQALFIGKALLWKKDTLKRILVKSTFEKIDILMKELFFIALTEKCKVVSLPHILLVKTGYSRDFNKEKKLLPLIQKNINIYTKWKGYLGKTFSYNPNSLAIYSLDERILEDTGFIIIEKDFYRTIQILSQLSIFCADNEIIIAILQNDYKKIYRYCENNNLRNVKILSSTDSYAKTVQIMVDMAKSPYHVILSDMVRWINRIDIERLVNSFLKPEVMIAVPQVATEGDSPRLVYAGAGINNISLNGSYFSGRSQQYSGEQDMAWTNYEVSMLNSYCLAARKEVWKKLFPLHDSVKTFQHFTNEISFLCLRKKIICEYAAQSSVWVYKEVGDFYKRDPITKNINLGDYIEEPRLSGNYWHVLSEYGRLIEEKEKDIPFLLRSYETYLKEDFRAFGLKNIFVSGKKRILVMTHELSLTGAPLVLVQAVKSLVNADYDILVASPEDGPLKDTYLELGIPVIIDPQIHHKFEYIRIAYDFDLIVVSTVVLWQCIEALSATKIPVFWWVHDSRIGYENYLRYVMPETLGDNIALYCGGEYARKVITDYRPKYHADILLYGLEDFSKSIKKNIHRKQWSLPSDKVIFANIGQIMSRKGQDVLVSAIRLLPVDILAQCAFVFVGKIVDRNVYKLIEDLINDFPHNIFYIEQMPYDQLKEFYNVIDCVICSSTDDPLPAFVAEALMMSRLCICSENTAFSSIIVQAESGYLFESGNEIELCSRICSVVENRDTNLNMRIAARQLYERTFSPQLFENNFLNIISYLLEK